MHPKLVYVLLKNRCKASGVRMSQEKTDQQIKNEYASLLKKAKIVSIILVLLILPRLILGFTSQETFLGLNYVTSLIPLVFGIFITVGFYYFLWRCPACNGLPGDSWSRTTCKKCNVVLK